MAGADLSLLFRSRRCWRAVVLRLVRWLEFEGDGAMIKLLGKRST